MRSRTSSQQRLLQVQGVGNVELGGAALPSVRIELNPLALARYGIALEDVRTALQSASANRPRGVIERRRTDALGQVYSNQAGAQARRIIAGIVDRLAQRRRGAAVATSPT